MSSRPILLDLYSGAGGAAAGYDRAGFEVVGVDLAPQPRYPFTFIQADALAYLAALSPADLDRFAAIHASPPCQAYSRGTGKERAAGKVYPDLLPPTRAALEATGLPWIIENVPGAPMRPDFILCGSMFGLPGLRRHRWFETSWHGFAFALSCDHSGDAVTVVGNGPHSRSPLYRKRRAVMQSGENAEQWWSELKKAAMGIDWMNRNELSEAIPPAYTEYLGSHLADKLKVRPLPAPASEPVDRRAAALDLTSNQGG
jgi:DNA (cytosine-5)-methyltransferase 1